MRDLYKDALWHSKVLHLDGHMLEAVFAAKFCQSRGVKVCYDAVEHILSRAVVAAYRLADSFGGIRAEDYWCGHFGKAAQILYETYHPKLVVLTQECLAAFF